MTSLKDIAIAENRWTSKTKEMIAHPVNLNYKEEIW